MTSSDTALRHGPRLANQRGIVLPLTLMIMMVLASLTVAMLSISGFEPLISQNLADATKARFAAEAGIDAAFNRLAGATNWTTLLANADANTGVLLFATAPMGSLPAGRGTYTVRLRNDSLAGDPTITGVTADPNATADDNGVLIVTSTGQVAGATKTVRVVMKRLNFLFPAALNFPGNEAETLVDTSAFEVDGRGWKMDGSGLDASCAPVFGISVSTMLPTTNAGGNEAVVESALSGNQKNNVLGKAQNPAQAGIAENTIAPDPTLTPQYIQSFIDKAKAVADITLDSTQANPVSFNNIGSSCTGDPTHDAADGNCWGSKNPTTGEINPKVVYIKGEADPTSMFHALTLGGTTTGYGILIVEDGDMIVNGNFGWYGPIIVTGKWVGIGFMGGGNQSVYGAVISNETASDPGFYEGYLNGNAKIRYSCEALNAALNARKLVSATNWKDLAPGE